MVIFLGYTTSYGNVSLLLFGWVTIFKPLLPTVLKGVDFRKSHLYQFLRHPGTGRFVVSGAVEDEGLIFRIFVSPGFYILGIFSNSTLNF